MTLPDSYRLLLFSENEARRLAVSGRFEDVQLLSGRFPGNHALVLQEIAALQAESGDMEGTLRLAGSLGPAARDRILAKAQFASGAEFTALEELRKLSDDHSRKRNLFWVGAAEYKNGHFEDALGGTRVGERTRIIPCSI